MKLAKLDVPESDGHINGRLDLGGTLKNPDLRLIGTIDDIVMGGKPWALPMWTWLCKTAN